jgi:hypothetical protein
MVGDIFKSADLIADAAYLELKPAAGQEAVIHNIYFAVQIEIKTVDGSGNELSFFEDSGKQFLTNVYFHIAEDHYLRVYNTSGGSARLAADGVITKEP